MGLVTKYYERAHKLNKKEPQHRACTRSIFSSIEVTNDSIFYYKQILREVQVHSLWNKKGFPVWGVRCLFLTVFFVISFY